MVQFFFPNVFQNLAAIVRHDLPKIPEDRRKFKAFKEFAQLDDKQAREALSPGSGPRLRVSDLKAGTYGAYLAGNEFHLNSVIVYQHQAIIDAWLHASLYSSRDHDRWVALLKRATLVLESVILHELVHWGDLKADGQASDGEARRHGWKDVGHWFAHRAYGSAFTIERDRLARGRRKFKRPALEIAGWLGWTTLEQDGKLVPAYYDPVGHLKPGSGPLTPPRSL